MRRSAGCSCCIKEELNRGPWTPEEDNVLREYIRKHGNRGNWRKVPRLAGLMRCGKSCRLRWLNYLRPDLKRGCFSEDEADLIIKLHSLLGNRWSLISGRLPGRSDNEVKNFWNFHLIKKLLNMGINPKTHKPLVPIESSQAAAAATARRSLPKVSSHSNPTAKELHQQKSFYQAEPQLVWLDQDEDYQAAEDMTNEIFSTTPATATTTTTPANAVFCYDWNNNMVSSSCSSSAAGSPSSLNWSSNTSSSSFQNDLWTCLLDGEGGQLEAQVPSELRLDGLVEFLDGVAWPQETLKCA